MQSVIDQLQLKMISTILEMNDKFGRKLEDLRISVTDRCNFNVDIVCLKNCMVKHLSF